MLADALGRHLSRHLGGTVNMAGAVRRMEEWVETVDLVSGIDDAPLDASFSKALRLPGMWVTGLWARGFFGPTKARMSGLTSCLPHRSELDCSRRPVRPATSRR